MVVKQLTMNQGHKNLQIVTQNFFGNTLILLKVNTQ